MKVYHFYREVPFDLGYPSAWRQRGYKVKEKQQPIAYLHEIIGGELTIYPLYSLAQVKAIKGVKAKYRRGLYLAALYGE